MNGMEMGLFVLLGCLAAVLSLAAILGWKGRGEGPDREAIRRYRDWQGQATSWSTFDELEDMIEQEKARGN
jgi:hypothetical protein